MATPYNFKLQFDQPGVTGSIPGQLIQVVTASLDGTRTHSSSFEMPSGIFSLQLVASGTGATNYPMFKVSVSGSNDPVLASQIRSVRHWAAFESLSTTVTASAASSSFSLDNVTSAMKFLQLRVQSSPASTGSIEVWANFKPRGAI